MSDTSRTNPIDWSLIDHHLQAGAYEAAAAALWEAQLASTQADDTVTAATVAAVRQICLACHECQTKIDRHQQAILESEQREAELSSHARALLTQISKSTPLEATDTTLGNSVFVKPDQPTTLPTSHHPARDAAGPLADTGSVTIWTPVLLFLHNLRRQIGLLWDTSPEEQSTFGPQPESTSENESEQVVDAWSVASIPVLITDDSTITETQLPFPALCADTRLESPVATTAEVVAEPADKATTEPTVEFIVEPLVELATDANVEATVEPTDDTSGLEIVSVIEDKVSDEPTAPSLVIYCLGTFQVYQDDQLVEEWPSSKGQLIFKYLLIHRERPVAKELLMDLFWPESPPDAARNNLNVAIYGLRRALRQGHPEFSHILFQNDAYLLNPELRIWVDVEEFNQHFRTGYRLEQAKELEQAVREYRAAEELYQGEFFEEDRYDDWLLPRRQSLQDDYLTLLDRLSRYYLEQADYDACIVMCNKLLAIDVCREDTHRHLMRCYSRQGYYHLALRQYHFCVEALQRELDVEPDATTQILYQQIHQRQPV